MQHDSKYEYKELTSGEKDFAVEIPLLHEVPDYLRPAKPTILLNLYWWFAAERQRIFFSRFAGKPWPWTSDSILNKYRFTNAYRASDRASQYLIKSVIYSGSLNIEEVFFRIILFKTFNSISTWQCLSNAMEEISWRKFKINQYVDILTSLFKKNIPIYSAAYIMPSAPKKFGSFSYKHEFHLALLKRMMLDDLPIRISQAQSLNNVYDLLHSYPGIGDFLAFQYAIDLNYSPIINFNENDFVVAGPGALRGISKCFADLGCYDETEIIRILTLNQRQEFDRCKVNFLSLWGRMLHLIDCQNLFCEIDKYTRVSHPEARAKNKRIRIKRKYQPNKLKLEYWYPPKWGIDPTKAPRNAF